MIEDQQITDDTQPIYERLSTEPSVWFARFLLYRNQEAARRSLLATYKQYQEQAGKGQKRPYNDVPGAWKEAALKYDWKFRAEQYDAELHKQAEDRARILAEIEQAEIERILTTDYAAMHERVKDLSAMAHDIQKSWRDPETGEIEFKYMAPDKIREWRGCLDDIAKELGQRTIKKDLKVSGELLIVTEWGGGVLIDEPEAKS